MSEPGNQDLEERLTQALELLARREVAPAVKRGRDWNAYAAVIASLIGLLALAVSGYTAYVQRQQLRAQVWPHLRLWESDLNPGVYITNQGTGPARVAAVRVTVNGAPVKTWAGVQQAVGFASEEGVVRSTINRVVLPAGKDYTVLQPADNEPSRMKFKELHPGGKHAIAMTVCYCSILEDCWTETFGVGPHDEQSHPPDRCPIPAAERFEQ